LGSQAKGEQVPCWQVLYLGQTVPQAPQLEGSVRISMQE